MHYHPLTPMDKEEMLKEIGVSSFDDLLLGIPAALRNPKVQISDALSEFEVQNLLKETLGKNLSQHECLSFVGGGSYDHFIPAAVPQIAGRNEFYTAYTPYQPEASQGTLQTIFEYQSLIAELTNLDVSNASHYDGATSLAEAVLLTLRYTERKKVLIARTVHPHYRQTVQTYLDGTPFSTEEFGMNPDGSFDRPTLLSRATTDVAAVVIQSPNFLGLVENLEGLSDTLHEAGILLIQVSNPISLALFKSPGEWGADIAVGEGQPLGITSQFGGPYLGYFATSRQLMRRIPGRLIGMTKDAEGRRAFVLTLKAREQDIRRERASSNICTNQGLCALIACIYMTLMGKNGMQRVAEINVDRASYLRTQIAKIPGFKVNLGAVIFNEFSVESPIPFKQLSKKLMEKKILPGIDLSEFYPELKHQFLICATETKTREHLDHFVETLKQC